MASKTSVELGIKGVDQTRGVFATIRARMQALGARLRIVAAGIAQGFKRAFVGLGVAVAGLIAGIRKAANNMSVLGDRAAQAGTSAQELNGLVVGLGVAGAKNANLESVTDALARMTKATGAVGAQGLQDTLAGIAALETEGERVAELSRIFGRSFGPGLAAIVRGGPDAVRAGMQSIMDIAPQMEQRLVDAGDAIADGMAVAQNNIKTGWDSAWVEMAVTLGEHFGIPAEQIWARLGAYIRYALGVAFRYISQFVQNGVTLFKNFWRVFDIVFGEEGLSGMLSRSLLHGWNRIRNWIDIVAARFAWLKDVVAAVFTDDTIEAANAKYHEATRRAEERLAAANADADADFGAASWSRIGERLNALGMVLNPDTADLKETLDKTLAAYADGALEKVRELGLGERVSELAGDAARSLSTASRQFAAWNGFGTNAARKFGFENATNSIEKQMLTTQQKQLAAVEGIAGALDGLEVMA